MENEGVIYLDQAGNRIDENGNKLDEPLTPDQVDRFLIKIKQREVDEQVRSNKVVEGILKDIFGEISMIESSLDNINLRQERDIMNENGTPLGDIPKEQQPGDETAEERSVIDTLAEIAMTVKSDTKELVMIANSAKQINEAVKLIVEQVIAMNEIHAKMADTIKGIAETIDAEIADEIADDQDGSPEKPEVEQPVIVMHMAHPTYGTKYSMCGSMGKPSQPFAAGENQQITDNADGVNCPECLRIMAEQKKT